MSTKKIVLTIMAAAFVSAAFMLAAVAVGAQIGSKTAAPAATQTETAPAADPEEEAPAIDPDSIIITGFETMRLKAGTYSQECDLLFNSSANSCNMAFSLYLPDGTIFYRSEPIEPGQRLETIEIDQKLEAGTYEGCRMAYDCYDPGTGAELNGADISFTLEVIP